MYMHMNSLDYAKEAKIMGMYRTYDFLMLNANKRCYFLLSIFKEISFVVCFGRHLQRFQVPLRSKEGGCLTISILENLSERENLTKCIWPEKGV